ncbi:MAG: DUF3168 domain-containing protein [Sulfurimonas sp.]
MIEEELFIHLKGSVPSVNERVYPLIMPQDCEKPALVYANINSRDNQGLEGCVLSISSRIQVDVYATGYSEMKAISQEVKAALYSFGVYPNELNSHDGFEEGQELFRQIIDFYIRR